MIAQERAALQQQIDAALDAEDLRGAATLGIEGYGPEILLHLLHVIDREDDAREVFSQFSEDLWRGIGGFRRQSSFRTWAYRLATSARARFYRDPYRRRGLRLDTEQALKLADRVYDSTYSRRAEREQKFERIRRQLTPNEQELLTLRVAQKMSWVEIAEIFLEPGEEATPTLLKRRAASLRKRYQRLKDQIRVLAREEQTH